VLILDEIDKMIDDDTAYFSNTNKGLTIKGLICALTAKKSYMLSATMDKFHAEFLYHVFNAEKSDHLVFRSMY